MSTKLYFAIALRIFILFFVATMFTFIPDYLRDFFGDSKHICNPNIYCSHWDDIDVQWNWGTRHYWYFTMCICLFILSLIACIIDIVKMVEKVNNK